MIKNKRYTPKKVILFILATLMFTGVFFALDTILFSKKYNSEEKYVEESLFSDLDDDLDFEKENYLDIAKEILKKKTEEELLRARIQKRKKLILKHIEEENYIREINKKQEKLDKEIALLLKNENNSENKNNNNFTLIKEKIIVPEIDFVFNPKSFSNNAKTGKKNIYKIINSKKIYNFIKELNIIFSKKRPDVRGRMKNKSVFLYAPQKMRKDELLAIFVHEFSHYIDIYTFNKSNDDDLSDKFYNISWTSTKTIRAGLDGKDFVSGYSMTNKYEDFAESFTYYVLHNKDFLYKSKKSYIMQKKYYFFKNKLFQNNDFVNTDFSKNNKVENYYRDITKIKFSTKNFLQYLKKSI